MPRTFSLKSFPRTILIAIILPLLIASSSLFAQQAPKAANLIPASIDEHNLVTLSGSVHPQARLANDRGAVAGNLPMDRMILVLKRGDAQEKSLESAIKAMHDPKSPQFHHWLTPKQFGAVYGPSDSDIERLTAWLRAHGFQSITVSQGRGTIEFSGTADSVTSAFHTAIHSYVVDGKPHFANATNPSIPAALSPVVSGVLSLHNFVKQSNARLLGKMNITHPGLGSPAQLKPDITFTNGAHGVVPGDLWTIYNSTPLITAKTSPIDGTGQTIAIAGRSDVSADDITGFRTTLLPAPYAAAYPFTQIINGPDPGQTSDDFLEQTLDVEYSTAMAPAAQIDLVVSGSTNTTDGVDLSTAYIVDNNLASVMSTSYGQCEAIMGTTEVAFYGNLWQQAAAQGITALVSSGDNGSAGCDLVGPSGSDSIGYVADEGLEVSGLASTPYNVAVGGNLFTDDSSTYWSATNLSTPAPLSSALSYVPETTWNESCSPLVCGNENADIAAGSGGKSGCFNATFDSAGNITACSGGYPEPDWQAGVAGLPSDGARHLPDVSLTAAGHDGYAICFQGSCDSGGVYLVGGTSASSPSFAGIMALVNQKTASRQGQANYTLYRLAAAEFGSAASPNTANLSSCNATTGNGIGSSCIFHDVTTGTNAVPCDGGTLNCSSTTVGVYGVLTGYAAGTGYDNATGLGSVNVTNLVNHWNDTTLTATSTALTLGATSSTFGQPVTLAVTVAPTTGTGTPTGQVALLTDSTAPGAATAGAITLANGAYSGSISSLPGGTYNVSARYGGDTTFGSSLSSTSAIVVAPAASSAKLTFAAVDAITGTAFTGTTAPYGSAIAETATLTGVSGEVAPSGNVTFLNAGKTQATQPSDATGVATYSTKGLAVGTYSLTASYAGSGNYTASAAPAISVTVGPASTALRLLSSTSYVVGTGTAKLSAIVVTDSLLANPTGNVNFVIAGNTVGTAAVSTYADPSTGASEAIATFTVPSTMLAAGANTVTASYVGDGNYLSSTSAAVSIGYSATAPVNTIALAASATSVVTTKPVTLTATVTTGGIPATAGTVNFFDGTLLLGSAQVVGGSPAKGFTTGTATLKPILATGSHSITATYAGILAAPTAVVSSAVTVAAAGTTASAITLTTAPDATAPANYDLTATVSGFGFAAPTAAVDFTETTVVDDFGSIAVDPKSVVHTYLAPSLLTAGDPSGATPAQSVTGDFNGDGIPDIATANASFTQSSMTVLLGNGDGTFQPPAVYAAGIFADAIVTGDFNGDGILDLAVTNQYNSTFNNGFVGIYLGNGDGTFQPQIVNEIAGFPINTVVADFNRDGILDIAAIQYYPAQFTVAFGNGDGTFQTSTATNYAITTTGSPYWIAGADLNGDGAIDLAEVNGGGDQTLDVFLNAGNGTFTLGSTLATGSGPQWISIADLNADGKQDLIISNYGDNTVGSYLGNGDGTFKAQVTAPLNGYGNSLALADLNGDGIPDLAAEFYYPQIGIGVLPGKGDGSFGKETDYSTGQLHGGGVTIADLNGDGAPDLISSDIGGGDVISQDISLLFNVTQAVASKTNVAIAGPDGVQQQIQATYAGDAAYNASASAGVFVKSSGSKSTPTIVWTPASPWGAGAALGASVLNASTDGGITGSFTYTAQSGTAAATAVTATSTLTAGTCTLTATFTPVDQTSYSVATATRTVTIVATDFALQTSVPTLTITSGSSGSFTASLASLYGFGGTVTLSGGANLPGGFTVSASPATINPGGTSTVTIKTTGITSSAALKPAQAWQSWTTGSGIALSFVLMLPLVRRRHRHLLGRGLACLAFLGVLIAMSGCGGEGFSTSTVALKTSAGTAASGTAVTLTATVSDSHSSLGGSVSFYNGNTQIGSTTITSGNTATLQISTLPVGLDSLSAVYTGDRHNSASTSATVSQLITGQTNVEIVATSGTLVHSTTVQVTLQ